MSPEEQLLESAAQGDVAKASALIDAGSDLAFQDAEGMSALMRAADAGHTGMVELLLEAGCPWNLQDKDGYCAGEYGAGYPEIVEVIMNWGVQAELVLGASQRAARNQGVSPVNDSYLKQKLHYSEDGTKLLDADGEAVMMGWEGPLMVKHAELICAKGGDVLNVGFGLGLIDEAIQTHDVTSHTIIEAHPDVYAFACTKGWSTKPGVSLRQGRWQEVVPQLLKEGKTFDGIFFDTYGEFYEEMTDFHELLPKLLKPGGVYSFFNGLAPDNLFFHTVYCRLAQLELKRIGFTTSYEKLPIREALDPAVWEGVKNKYWHLPFYFLPSCVLDGAPTAGNADI